MTQFWGRNNRVRAAAGISGDWTSGFSDDRDCASGLGFDDPLNRAGTGKGLTRKELDDHDD